MAKQKTTNHDLDDSEAMKRSQETTRDNASIQARCSKSARTEPKAEHAEHEQRDARGRWKPGVSGNRKGLNQFAGRKAFQNELLRFVDVGNESRADQKAIWRCFIELCKAGDAWAIRAYLERRWPVGRAKDGIPEVTVRNYTGLHFEKFAREQVNITVVSGIEDAPGSRLPKSPVVEAEKVAPVEAESAPESTNSPQPAPPPSEPEPEPPVYNPNPSTWEIALPPPQLPSTAKFDPDP